MKDESFERNDGALAAKQVNNDTGCITGQCNTYSRYRNERKMNKICFNIIIKIHKNVHNKHNTQSNILYTNVLSALAVLILCMRY